MGVGAEKLVNHMLLPVCTNFPAKIDSIDPSVRAGGNGSLDVPSRSAMPHFPAPTDSTDLSVRAEGHGLRAESE